MIFYLLLSTMLSIGKTSAQHLDDYRWKNRVVLLFAGPGSESLFRKQVNELNVDPEGLLERDLIIFTVSPHRIINLIERKTANLSAEQLWDKYSRQGEGFQYILIGKDGGIKLDKNEFIPNDYLFAVIDAMPMRKREMQENKYN